MYVLVHMSRRCPCGATYMTRVLVIAASSLPPECAYRYSFPSSCLHPHPSPPSQLRNPQPARARTRSHNVTQIPHVNDFQVTLLLPLRLGALPSLSHLHDVSELGLHLRRWRRRLHEHRGDEGAGRRTSRRGSQDHTPVAPSLARSLPIASTPSKLTLSPGRKELSSNI